MTQMSNHEIGITPESAFRIQGDEERFVRICLGGRAQRDALAQTLTHLNYQIWQLSM